ncbi:MAG TPA: hypothetical protein VFY23_04525 [Candidatus Limnocylindrales bacterium]|nr:hypothetical protein [Candidatus Limnocylindrales bacterium]
MTDELPPEPPPPPAPSVPGPAAPPPAPGAPQANPLRELLFADLGPAETRATFARGGAATAYLVALADAAERRNADAARNLLAGGLVPPAERETRAHLQAWHLSRLAGVDPGADAKDVLGVVVDVHLDEGLDSLAAFLDGSARYLNHSGGGVVWETPDMAVGQLVRAVIGEAAIVVAMGAPLDGERPGPPPPGGTSIWVLTRGGIYLGTGPSAAISADPRGGPVMQAATELLRHLVTRSSGGTASPG